MQILAVLCGFGILALLQIPPLIRKGWWRDLTVYAIVYVLVLAASLSYALDWPLVSPTKLLTVFMNAIYRFLGYQTPD